MITKESKMPFVRTSCPSWFMVCRNLHLRKSLASGLPTFYALPIANAGMFTLAS